MTGVQTCALPISRGAGDLMAVAQKERYQPAADGAGGAGEKYFHVILSDTLASWPGLSPQLGSPDLP